MNYRADLEVVFQNKVQTSQYRAVGHPRGLRRHRAAGGHGRRQGRATIAFDIRAPQRDPRRRLSLTSPTGYQFEALSHHACLAKLQEMMDYDAAARRAGRTAQPKASIAASALPPSSKSPIPARPSMASAARGSRRRTAPSSRSRRRAMSAASISVTELGQGTETIIGQIVAEHLGVDRDRVKVMTGDTDTTPHGGATYACRGAGIGGETALQATKKLKANVLAVAAAILQDEPEKLDIHNGWIVDAATAQQRIELSEIARIAYFRSDTLPPGTQAQLSVAHHYAPQGYPFAFTNGVQACHLELDVETGLVKILKLWVVEDCGRVINPLLVDEQIRGGVVQGLARRSSRNASTETTASSPMARSPTISCRWRWRCRTSKSDMSRRRRWIPSSAPRASARPARLRHRQQRLMR